VISVGNLTVGGTGKTPMVIYLARVLNGQGRRVGIIRRGYGRDEQILLEEALAGIPVFQGRDRVALARRLIAEMNVEVILLDDGFSYRRLARDLDILLIDAVNGFGDGVLLPAGVLREDPAALRRADIVVLTKADLASSLEDVLRRCARLTDRPLVQACYRCVSVTRLPQRERLPVSFLRGKTVVTVAAIADPFSFERLAAGTGAEIGDGIHYPDHHEYSRADLDDLYARAGDALVLTTAKDAVKLTPLLSGGTRELYALDIEMNVCQNKETLFAGLTAVCTR